MFKAIALSLLIGFSNNTGVATNSNYVQFANNEGYYLEDSTLVERGDIVYISPIGDVFVIENRK